VINYFKNPENMTKLMRLLAATSLFAIHALACGQSLWGGAKYGMTVEQVKLAIPNVTTPSNPSRLGDGAQELLRLENVEIVNKRFTASLYFIAGKVTQVTLTLEKGESFNSAMRVFDSLTEALRAKYGREINRSIKHGLLNRADATWMAGRTNINVFAMSVGGNDAILNINYQVRLASDADKL